MSNRDAIVAEIPRLRRYARTLTGREDTLRLATLVYWQHDK